MSRCLQLAKLGEGRVAPNPMVGAVLVHDNHIIGEGYHQHFGGPHAEVNCINSVVPQNQYLVSRSVLYVSLEPCSHFGKTPPCVDLIIRNQIKKVVIGTVDPFEKVDGSGISRLKNAGIDVVVGVLEKDCAELNKHFFHFHTQQRPFVTLKWAETADGFIAAEGSQPIAISAETTNRWVHQLRATHSAIMVGFNTAKQDNPSLTSRFWPGPNPLRIVVDNRLELGKDSNLFTDANPTLVLNLMQQKQEGNIEYCLLKRDESLIKQLMRLLYKKNILSLMVEGGTTLLQSFINEGHWNEAYQIHNSSMFLGDGVKGPIISAPVINKCVSGTDEISFFKNS